MYKQLKKSVYVHYISIYTVYILHCFIFILHYIYFIFIFYMHLLHDIKLFFNINTRVSWLCKSWPPELKDLLTWNGCRPQKSPPSCSRVALAWIMSSFFTHFLTAITSAIGPFSKLLLCPICEFYIYCDRSMESSVSRGQKRSPP